jgi:DNA-binding GntR family transcriptional regulator
VSTARTRAEAVYRALRADILAGRVLPGSRLRFADLCTRYEASMSVLREGLSRLAEQGLVVSEPQHGFRVTPVSVEDLRDLTDARVAIEGLVLRRAMAEGDVAWESRLVAALHVMERTPMMSADDPDLFNEDWTAAHAAYHTALLDGCANERLRAVAAGLRDAAELYRRWSKLFDGGRSRDIPAEHRAIVAAVLARDADRAVALLAEHVSYTTEILLEAAAAQELSEREATG